MSSSTYRQSSADGREAPSRRGGRELQTDPENKLLWRYPRRRLEGEVIRDSALSVSGLLNGEIGGPSVWPELPPGMSARGGWKTSGEESDRCRRSIYVAVKRNTRYPMFETFDMPDTHESCARRNVTTSPAQALTMLNSELTLKWARHFAERVMRRAGDNQDRQIEMAFRLAYCRPPDQAETKIASDFFQRHTAIISERINSGERPVLPAGVEGDPDAGRAALVDLCHMLLNSNEFVYVN